MVDWLGGHNVDCDRSCRYGEEGGQSYRYGEEGDMVSMVVDLDKMADMVDRTHMVMVMTDKVMGVAVVVSDELENTSMDIKYDLLIDSHRTVEMQG